MATVVSRVRKAVAGAAAVDRSDLLAEADAARAAGRYAQAAELFERHVSANPGAAGAMVQAGHMRKESGSLAEAEAHYLAALALLPEDFDLHLQLGHFYKVAGRLEEAGRFYRQASELRPDSAEAKAEAETVAVLLSKPQMALQHARAHRARMTLNTDASEFARNVPAEQFAAALADIVAHKRFFLLAGVEQRFPDPALPVEDAVQCVSACLGAGMVDAALLIVDGLCRTSPVPRVPVSLVAQCMRAVLDGAGPPGSTLETLPASAQLAMLNVATNVIARQKALIDRLL